MKLCRMGAMWLTLVATGFGQVEKTVPVPRSVPAETMVLLARHVGDMPEVRPDATGGALTLRGTADQVALVEFLMTSVAVCAGPAVYRDASQSDDVTRVFPVTHAVDGRDLAALSTVVRSIFEVRRMINVDQTKCVAARGTAEQMRGVEWLLAKLDRPASSIGDKKGDEDALALSSSGESVRVFHLVKTPTEVGHQAAVTSIRTATRATRGFVYMPTRVFAIRGTPEQIAKAESMVAEIDGRPEANR